MCDEYTKAAGSVMAHVQPVNHALNSGTIVFMWYLKLTARL